MARLSHVDLQEAGLLHGCHLRRRAMTLSNGEHTRYEHTRYDT